MEKYKKIFPLFGFISGIIFSMLIFISWSKNENPNKDLKSYFDLPQVIKSIKLQKDFDFAGEKMPLNEDTKERLDRELSVNAYWQSTTLLHIKMAEKFFPYIEKTLAENNIPDDFKYLAVAESSLRNATSSASAKGFWQFMKPSALEMGLIVNDEVDERFHVEKSTLAACKYLKQLKSRLGNWTNAAAAYNVGPTSFVKQQSAQGESSYYDMNLNAETSRYVFRIIAIKEILANPVDFGYVVDDEDKYTKHANFKEVLVNTPITSLANFAHEHGTTYRLLKYYNPWLISDKLTILNGANYTIKIPI